MTKSDPNSDRLERMMIKVDENECGEVLLFCSFIAALQYWDSFYHVHRSIFVCPLSMNLCSILLIDLKVL